LVGDDIKGYGCPGMSSLAWGLVHMEVNRGDGSLGTFLGVQAGLAMRAINLLGSDEQRERWLPGMARVEQTGAFALTEPDHGSDSVALETRARRDGDEWVIDGAKRWIGNGSVADVVVVWARDEADDHVKGFLVERARPATRRRRSRQGLGPARSGRPTSPSTASTSRWRTNSRPRTRSRTPAAVLVATRGVCAWAALGHAVAAYDAALTYALQREQSASHSPASRSCRTGS